MKKIGIILTLILLVVSLVGCENSEAKKAIKQGKIEMNNKEYDKALASFKIALDKESSNEEAKRLTTLIDNYKKANDEFEKGNINDANKIMNQIDEETIKLYTMTSKIMIKSDNITMISSLMNGQYPQYNQLIPQTFPKEAKINVSKIVSAIERVSTMVNEKTSIVKFEFTQNNLSLKADTPEAGNSEDQIDIIYNGEDITIAFNYRYLLDCFKNIDSEDLIICMNTNLSATVIKPDNDEDFIYLVMPVQIR